MLYQIGSLTLDTFPMGPDSFKRSSGPELAAKPVMGGLQPRERTGDADAPMTIAGRLLPTKVGGMADLEQLHALSVSATQVPVMRGDGKMLGWYIIENVSEDHRDLTMLGIGFVVSYTLQMIKVDTDRAIGSNQAGGLVGMLMSLFEAL